MALSYRLGRLAESAERRLSLPRATPVADGAKILKALFDELTEAKGIYRKVEHGAALTDWICSNDPTHFTELAKYLRSLVQDQSPRESLIEEKQ